uniref:Uncharacterized protein n=1 Tax=Oryza brachyantha TaxID=4533 RepID=J3MMD9_ORYBR
MKDAMSVPDVTKKTSGVALEDLPASSATGRAPPSAAADRDALSAVIASARQFQDKQRDIARRREEARRELAEMVRTVEFNDPYISPLDALKP